MSEWFGDFTIFTSERARQGQVISLTFSGLIELLREPKVCESKSGTQAFLPGRLKPDGHRRKADVLDLCALCVDFDHGRSPEHYAELWKPYAHIIVSTHSHRQDAPRFRVIFPLAQAVAAGDWPDFYRHASTRLSRGDADSSTLDAARIWYLPSCPKARVDERIFHVEDGALLDPREFYAEPAACKRFSKPSEALERSVTWQELLEPHGWKIVRQAGDITYWVRPGKNPKDGHSAVVNGGESGVFYNFSACAEHFAANKAFSKFAAFAFLNHGGDFKLAAKAIRATNSVARNSTARDKPNDRAAIADLLDDLACGFYNGDDGEQYVRWRSNAVERLLAISSNAFSDQVRLEFRRRSGQLIPAESLEKMRAHAAAIARQEPVTTVWARVGVDSDAVWWDLGGGSPKYVKLTSGGWSIESSAAVLMTRPAGMLELPEPVPGGDFGMLRSLVNCPEYDLWCLLCAFLVGCFFPDTALPLLIITGEQGSGKSILAKRIKQVIDPGQLLKGRLPKDDREWLAMIANNYALVFDNLSRISTDQSDALCTISTEGSFASRALYTNKELAFVSARRPVIMTSIDRVVERADLASRSVVLDVSPLIGKYRPEQELNKCFETILPKLLGALCDAVCLALANRQNVKVDPSIRMSDFLRNAIAAETAFGFPTGTTERAYLRMCRSTNNDAIDSDELATAIIALCQARDGEELTASEILQKAKEQVDDATKLPVVNQFAKWVKRMAPVLRQAGAELQKGNRRGNKRPYILRYVGPDNDDTNDDNGATTSSSSTQFEPDNDNCDGMTAHDHNSLGSSDSDDSALGMFLR